MPGEHRADIIVVGGGIVGCAAAYYLAKRGARVTLLERRGIGAGATGRSGGGVRQSARASEELPLAQESIALFPSLSDELGVDVEYTRQGNLRLVEAVDHVRPMKVDIERQQRQGLNVRWLEPDDVLELAPALNRERIFGASFCPTDGHCNPLKLVTAYAQAAHRVGVEIVTGCEVHSIRQLDSGEARVENSERAWRAPAVLIAAGAGSRALCQSLGFNLPLANIRYESLITEALPPMFAPMFGVASGDLFFRQTRHGGVHFGGGLIEQSENEGVTRKNLQMAAEHLVRLAPPLGDAALLRTWGGLDPNTPDGLPIIDRLNENVILATGFCGHGLALGPVVGLRLAEWLAGGDGAKPAGLAPFKRSRLEGWLQTKWTPSGTFEAALATDTAHTTQSGGDAAPALISPEADESAGPRLLRLTPELCTGCRMCEMACAISHGGIARSTQLRIKIAYPSDEFFAPITCIHCEEAYCLPACAFNALEREPGDIVRVIEENCTGCLLCVEACPYGGIEYYAELSTVIKCDLCGGDPACAVYCPTHAIQFAPIDEPTWEKMKAGAVDNVPYLKGRS